MQDAHAQPGVSDSASNSPDQHSQSQFRMCRDCLANQPIAAFGLAKYSAGGRSHICQDCRAQFQRLKRVEKYKARSTYDDSCIRSVRIQNETILPQVLSTPSSIWAYQPETKLTFKVVFGIGSFGLPSMKIHDLNDQLLHEYSGVDAHPQLMAILKQLGLRLEMTELSLLAAKTLIYYV